MSIGELCLIPVNQPPTFTMVPADMQVKEGQTTQISCTVKGQPSPAVKWYKGEESIDEDLVETSEEVGDVVSQMIITNTQPEDEHMTYRVEASNDVGCVEHCFSLQGNLILFILHKLQFKYNKDNISYRYMSTC